MTGFALLTLSCQASSEVGAGPPLRIDAERVGSSREPFVNVVGARALSTGSVLVSDIGARALLRLDFMSQRIDTLGRIGRGPGEFVLPGRLFPLGEDSTVMADDENARLLLILPSGELVAWHSWAGKVGFVIRPRGVDQRGCYFFETPPGISFERLSTASDSAAVVRSCPGRDALDTLAWIQKPRTAVATLRTPGTGRVDRLEVPQPFAVRDEWSVDPHGVVAVARGRASRVEWLDNVGVRAVGPIINYELVPVTKADKSAYRSPPSSLGLVVTWPARKPPFEPESAIIDTGGRLWIGLSRSSKERRSVFDVFDAGGHRLIQVQFDDVVRIVGFAGGDVLAVHRDSSGLEWMIRYRIAAEAKATGSG